MVYDASDFPSEGQTFNTEGLLPSVDYMLANMHNVQRRVGAKRPDYIPPNISNEPPQPKNESIGMPEPINSPLQSVEKNNSRVEPIVSRPNVSMQKVVVKNVVETTFFKDISGNKYKTVGEKLYVLGWQDSDIEIRLVSEKTGKTVPTEGKKFQIYGWHLVNKMNDKNEVESVSKINTVEDKLSTIKVKPTDVEPIQTENTIEPVQQEDNITKTEKQTKNRKTKRLI